MHALNAGQQSLLAELLSHSAAGGQPEASSTTARGSSTPVSRRGFIGSTAAGLVIGVGWLRPGSAKAAMPGVEGAATGPLAPNAFVRVGSDNLVTIICKHHEMGQGNTTGLATIAADELDADWSLVRTEYAPSDPKLYNNSAFGPVQGTGGSTAIANSYDQLRKAGAAARTMLVAAAADAWKVPASEITASNSVLSHPSGKRASYGEMAAAAGRLTPPENPALKTPAQFTLIGKEKATHRIDSPSKCDGSALYTSDVKLPGLLTAVIAWPPGFGARLVSFDAAAARRVNGVTDVVEVPEGVAVVGKGTWAALQGRRALKVRWDESGGAGLDSEALFARFRAQVGEPGGTVFAKAPDAEEKLAGAARTIEAVYEFPFLAHAPMEPMNCVAWLHDGGLETWAGHQLQTLDHIAAAKAAGLSPEKVKLHTLVSGGSFGRRANGWSDFTVAAVNVAKAIGGRAPVRLQYTREDDNGAGLYRPLFVHAVKAGLGADGRIAGWQHAIVGQSIMAGGPFAAMIKDGVDPSSVEGVFPTPYGIEMNGELHSPVLPVRPLWWRSVGNTHTAFVMETMMDELAAAAGKDPLAFRLSLLDAAGDEKARRMAGTLRLAAEKAGWGRAMPAGTAQGLAVHHSFESYVAQVAEVSLKAGKVRVERVVCAVDCGVPVNPDVIRAQMEGGIGFALGALYYGEIEIRDGRAQQLNFDTYRSLRIHEMPRIEVAIVASEAKPTGVGEPGVPPLAPAVANALARLDGRRVRRLPLSREALVAA